MRITPGSGEKSDLELFTLAKQDPKYFGILMERYEKPLFNYIRRVSDLPKEDIEDLLQEIFLKVYLQLNKYPEIIKFSSWIYRIAHNHLVDHFRRISARPRTNHLEHEEWIKMIKDDPGLEKKINDADCAEKIKIAIAELPFKYKEALILRHLEEKEYEEIMDILKKPKGSVATLLRRGKRLLSKGLKQKGIDCFN